MRALFSGSCAKEPDRPEANEDAYAFSADGQRIALSDGASESYDSQLWARLLVTKFAEHPGFDAEWLHAAVSDYLREHDFAMMSWSQQLAFERGCFATLLAAEHDALACRVNLFAVGDSVALLFDEAALVRAWPLDTPERFRDRPTLLCTLRGHNKFTNEAGFYESSRATIDLLDLKNPTLLCMTDALGEWTLRMSRDEPERLIELLAIRADEQLTRLVISERKAKRMRVDDSTLIILRFDSGEDGHGLPQP